MNDKIGLCLAFKGTNYGALLQAFATQQIVERFGYKTEIIDFNQTEGKTIISSPESYLARIIEKGRKITGQKATVQQDELHKKNQELRRIVAEKFRHEHLHGIVKISSYDNLVEHSKSYKAVIVGSDQLWPPTVAFTYFYTLRFVPKDVRKISYATSTGVSSYPWYVKRYAAQFLEKIDFLSVREDVGQRIVKAVCNRDAKVVLDPTYLFTKGEWEKLIPHEKVIENGYVFCFFLGDNPSMKRLAKEYAEKHGLRIVAILSNEVNVDDSDYADEILIGQRPDQFINLIRNAECVFTDSFHGFAFTVINEKQVFITYRNRKGTQSRNSRINNIVNLFGMAERLIKDPITEKIDNTYPINYQKVGVTIRELREDSLEFLRNALLFTDTTQDEDYEGNVLYDSKTECCGCEACANSCPQGIIKMTADEEGFYYPHIVEPSKCVGCNACHNVCPIEHADQINSVFTIAYAGWSKIDTEIISSSSGGFAAGLTDAFLKSGGVVYGVAYTSDFSGAQYIRIVSEEQAALLKTSKYIQARKNEVYRQVREDLKNKKVLFAGVPCDIYALKRFIRDDSNLYAMSIICHGPTSELVHKEYCSVVEQKLGSSINSFSVRYKKNGNWKPYFIRATGDNENEFLEQFNQTDYNTGFIYFKRPSCGDCSFKNDRFAADILVGDYHSASAGSANWNPHGMSTILPLTKKGNELVHLLDDRFIYYEIPLKTAISQKAVHSSVIKNIDRNEFVKVLHEKGLHEACLISSIKDDMKRTMDSKKKRYIVGKLKRAVKLVLKKR